MEVVETVKVELEVGKESKEVIDAIHDLVKDIKEGKGLTVIAGENLPGLAKAIEGIDMLDDEGKHKSRNATLSYAGYKLADALVPVQE